MLQTNRTGSIKGSCWICYRGAPLSWLSKVDVPGKGDRDTCRLLKLDITRLQVKKEQNKAQLLVSAELLILM